MLPLNVLPRTCGSYHRESGDWFAGWDDGMIKQINGQPWFCCPRCGKKIHPVKPGAQGVFAMCKGKKPDGGRCNWAGEIRWDK